MKQFICSKCGSTELVKVIKNAKTLIPVKELKLSDNGEIVIPGGEEIYTVEMGFECRMCHNEVSDDTVKELIDTK